MVMKARKTTFPKYYLKQNVGINLDSSTFSNDSRSAQKCLYYQNYF